MDGETYAQLFKKGIWFTCGVIVCAFFIGYHYGHASSAGARRHGQQ